MLPPSQHEQVLWPSPLPLPAAASSTTTTRFRVRDSNAANSAAQTPDAANGKKRQGSGARLNDATRLEIIALLNAPEPLSLRKIAKQFGVVEATIRHVRDRASVITTRALAVSEDVRLNTRRVVQKAFPELETQLAAWLEANGYDPTSLDANVSDFVMRKATELAAVLAIPPHEFSPSKSWLKTFQRRRAAALARAQADDEAQSFLSPAVATTAPLPLDDSLAVAAGRPKRKRGAGPRLSDSQRLEIIALLQHPSAHVSNRKLAERFGVDEATIRHIKANASAIAQRARSLPIDVRQTTFRAGRTQFAELEAVVADWIDASRRCGHDVPPHVVRRRAEDVARQLAIPDGAFKASLNWYTSFCRRRGLGPVVPIDDLEAIVAAYEPANVYTVDETGLFYRLLPQDAEASVAAFSTSSTVSRTQALDRVTLVVCCNATGSDKLPVSVIARKRVHDAPLLPCFTQPNAWLDAHVFSQWFDDVFAPHVEQQQQRRSRDFDNVQNSKVLLLLDNAPGHPVSFERGDIRVLALHPKSAAWVPPLERGVITALKNRYKHRVLQDVLAYRALPVGVQRELTLGAQHVRAHSAGLFFGRAPHLLDAAQCLADAWADVSPELLRCAFEDANFVSQLRIKREGSSSSHAAAVRVEAVECELETDMLALLQRFDEQQQQVGDADASTLATKLQTFLHLDDESSAFYQQCIADEVDSVGNDNIDTIDTRDRHSLDTPSTAMDRILNSSSNGSLSTSAAAVAVHSSPAAAASVVNVPAVLTSATLLGMQLRQLQATNSAVDAQVLEQAVRAIDALRRELFPAVASVSTLSREGAIGMRSESVQPLSPLCDVLQHEGRPN